MNEEYTDYSCSTSVERLARQVETLLREWHLVNGCDRHASFSFDNQTTRLIRSAPIMHMGGSHHSCNNRNPSNDLTLSLWDAPSCSIMEDHNETNNGPHIPLSLQRRRRTKRQIHAASSSYSSTQDDDTNEPPQQVHQVLPPNNNTSHHDNNIRIITNAPNTPNLSTLFGIGQHLVLCPTTSHYNTNHPSTTKTTNHDHIVLQMALNWATAACDCRIPAFGLPHVYSPTTLNTVEWNHSPNNDNRHNPSVAQWVGRLHPGPHLGAMGATFSVWTLHKDRHDTNRTAKHTTPHNMPLPSLHALGHYFAQQASSSSSSSSQSPHGSIDVTRARHSFAWTKPSLHNNNNNDDSCLIEWRRRGGRSPQQHQQQQQIQQQKHFSQALEATTTTTNTAWNNEAALTRLEHALAVEHDNTHDTSVLWGPVDDPISHVTVHVEWQSSDESEDHTPMERALLTLPLKIRSQNVSWSDVDEMEHSLQRTIFHPMHTNHVNNRPNECHVSVEWDAQTAVTTASASCKCVLASLIRVVSDLTPSLWLGHLAHRSVLLTLAAASSNTHNNDATMVPLEEAVGPVTRKLVEAMEWSLGTRPAQHAMERHAAQTCIQQILAITCMIPQHPIDDNDNPMDEEIVPMGHLVSILMGHMARVRTPWSMALLWQAFVTELRHAWDQRQPLFLGSNSSNNNNNNNATATATDVSSRTRMNKKSLGRTAPQAAFCNSSEPDPHPHHCFLQQKLQLLNIGIECTLAWESLQYHQQQQQQDSNHVAAGTTDANDANDEDDDDQENDSLCMMAETNISEEEEGILGEKTPSKNLLHLHPDQEDVISPMTQSDSSLAATPLRKGHGGGHTEGGVTLSPSKSLFKGTFSPLDMEESEEDNDSEEEDEEVRQLVDSMPFGKHNTPRIIVGGEQDRKRPFSRNSQSTSEYFDTDCYSIKSGHSMEEAVLGIPGRPGARCPVQGVSLIATGDQLYAPYLQRTCPLTNDTILERRIMLSPSEDHPNDEDDISSRMAIAQRLQKAELLCDMRAFKSANPGAIFKDFLDWYGNPGNPLTDYEKDGEYEEIDLSIIIPPPTATFNAASQIRAATRTFWMLTWNEATPCAAAKQEPLFDAERMVESSVFHSLETMHPAQLMVQVLAVNFSMVHFALQHSASDSGADQVPAVRRSIDRLAEKLQDASRRLDMSTAVDPPNTLDKESFLPVVPMETISSCEAVCDAIADVEIVLSRATSLLDKFPGEYDLVQTLLDSANGSVISVERPSARKGILQAIQRQQQNGYDDDMPRPSQREYVLRNREDDHPCQLTVQINEEGDSQGMVLALTRCERE